MLSGELRTLPQAQDVPDCLGLLRRRQLMEPKTSLLVAILGDGAEGEPLLGPPPEQRRAAHDPEHPTAIVPPSVD